LSAAPPVGQPASDINRQAKHVDAVGLGFRTWVRLPPPPPGFVRNAVRNEACHGVAGKRSRATPFARRPNNFNPQGVSNYALAGPAAFDDLNNFYYVYILVSETDKTRHYTGITEDLEARLKAHNRGQVLHTSKYRPWRIETSIAFSCRSKASNFEKYLKSHSGRAFASKHF